MKRIMVAALFAVVLVSILLLATPMTGSAADKPSFTLYPPDAQPFGLTYAQWAAKWWQWQLLQPTSASPNLDLTGCTGPQSGPVWFLAGSFGVTANRTCTIPFGRALLFPIMNEVYLGFPWDRNDTPLKARTTVQQDISNASVPGTFGAVVDRVAVRNVASYRLYKDNLDSLPLFDVHLLQDNLFGLHPGIYKPCSDDGYYLMLAPLPPGEHEIHFYAKQFGVDVTYHLTVQ